MISDLVRHPNGRVAKHLQRIGESKICTSIIVAAELRFGVAKKGSAQLTADLEAILGAMEVLPFEAPADKTYAALRTLLEKSEQPIGANDLLIASHTMALGYTLVTDNEREFSRIRDLEHENWRR